MTSVMIVRTAIIVLRNFNHQLIDDNIVVALQLSAERVGHEPFGEVAGQVCLPLAASRPFNSAGVEKYSFPLGSLPAESMTRPSSFFSRQRPMASKFSNPKPIGSRILWQLRAGGFRLVQLGALAQRQSPHFLVVLLFEFGNVRRRRWDAFTQDLLQHPYPSPHGAGTVGERGGRQRGRHAEDAAAVDIRQLHPTHLRPKDGLLEAIHLGERFIEERVVAVYEPHHALVLAHDAFKK